MLTFVTNTVLLLIYILFSVIARRNQPEDLFSAFQENQAMSEGKENKQISSSQSLKPLCRSPLMMQKLVRSKSSAFKTRNRKRYYLFETINKIQDLLSIESIK